MVAGSRSIRFLARLIDLPRAGALWSTVSRSRRAAQSCARGAAALRCPPAQAYIGPGAGFALLSSFLVLFTTIVLALFSLLVWPFRLLWRAPSRAAAQQARGSSASSSWASTARTRAHRPLHGRRQAARTSRSWPGWAATSGCGTTYPVALAGGLVVLQHRHQSRQAQHLRLPRPRPANVPAACSPRLTSASVERFLKLGRYRIPLEKPELRLLRKSSRSGRSSASTTSGARCCAFRSRSRPTASTARSSARCACPTCWARRARSSSTRRARRTRSSRRAGIRVPVTASGDRHRDDAQGPGEHVPAPAARALELPLTIDARRAPDGAPASSWTAQALELHGEDAQRLGHADASAPRRASRSRASCRMMVTELDEHFSLYVTPINIDPEKPGDADLPSVLLLDLPAPSGSAPTARSGLAEDTWALNEGVIDDATFLEQTYDIDSRAPGDVLRRRSTAAHGHADLRVRRHRPHPAHVLALLRARTTRPRAAAAPSGHAGAIESDLPSQRRAGRQGARRGCGRTTC